MTDRIDTAARAICAEQCAHFGEPPCWEFGEWPNEQCEDPGCRWLAEAAVAALDQARNEGNE